MTTIQIEADTVPEILRATRALSGLTTRELAPMIGVSHAAIARWERGEGEPSVTQFVLWAQATKQPAQRLLDGLNVSVRHEGLEPPTFWSVASLDVEYELLLIAEAVEL
ncbi:helix-turn-helix domain-containing protein [Agriterribacter sp.]|uniref:helix-turn-helix domain-containing protein n=1 Tax=Agriterribacter sp. TaxID=2821509 RepID=UPI002BEC0072|nr:helix-turn-helix domain-containing protein [Agriterribacter sp.]HTN05267.1 helix-turn-helix domain-containing protein [Agriterribacter sp.]